MSLYTLSKTEVLPSIKLIRGVRMEQCSNIDLLAAMGTTTAFDVENRLANGHKAFVSYVNNEPAAFGWMASQSAKIGELNHQIKLAERNRYLWNFRTLEKYRGMGLYPALLQYIINYEIEKADRFWIIHAPENNASLNGILKAGFQFVGTLYINEYGIAVIKTYTNSSTYETLLDKMNIPVSTLPAPSCWNCSSPYLKKRTKECCCEKSQNQCFGKNQLVMAS